MLFEQFQESDSPDRTYRCENCERTFKAVDIVLVSPPKQFTKPVNGYRFVNKFGRVIGGTKPPNADAGDKVYGCPHCLHPHMSAIPAI